jgi:DNA polymerase-1
VSKKKEELPDFGIDFYNCDTNAGGVPLCRLGQLTNSMWAPKTLQLKGAAAADTIQKARPFVPLEREYDIMLVGEAPGKIEDRLGIPFVGDAGDILTGFLADSGMDVERVYVTNMVKCRPPKNRTPCVKEIKTCLGHIYHEIRTIKPKVIMLLGRVPLQLFNLTAQGGVGKARGKLFEMPLPRWQDGPIFKVIPTYHPAAFLYRPDEKLKARVRDDFKFAQQVATTDATEKQEVYDVKYEVADTVDKVREMVEQVKVNGLFSFDTESPDLHFWDSPMRLLQISIGLGKSWVIPFYNHVPDLPDDWKDWRMKPHFQNGDRDKVIEILREIFENAEITKTAHNAKYDMNVVFRWLKLKTLGWIWDTSIMHHLLYEYSPHDLEFLSDIELATGDYGFLVREIVGHGKELRRTYDWIPDEILWPYGATDAESGYRLCEIYYARLAAKPHLLQLYKEESHDTIRSLQEAEYVGNKIIVPNVKELDRVYSLEIEDLTTKCRQYTTPEFNPGSYQQVAEAFIGLGMLDKVASPLAPSGVSTAKDILLEIDHPLAQHVIDFRNRRKMLSTYVNNVLEDIDRDGRVRYGFNPNGTVNGGLSCKFLHQIPRINEEKVDAGEQILRSIFGEDDDFWYFYSDFSQIELRIFGYITGQQELIDILESNGDVHAFTAAAALDIEMDQVSDFNRSNVGKRLNFGVIYGSEGFSVAKGEYEDPRTGERKTIGLNRALLFVESFRSRYNKINEYLLRVPEEALCTGGILRLPFGRERRMIGLNDPDAAKRAHAEREATNATIQAPARAITMRTINLVRRMLEQHKIGTDKIRFLNTVHDSIAYGVRKDYIEWFPQAFKVIAERRIPEVHNKYFPVKMGYGKTWTEAERSAA